MKIGIIAPSETELEPILKELIIEKIDKKAKLNFITGKYYNVDIVTLFCGVCKVNAAIATQILIDCYDVTHIFNVGVAGAICESLNIGDTVISTEITYHDVADGILTEYHPWMESIYFKGDEYLLNKSKEALENNDFNFHIKFGRLVTGEAFIDTLGRDTIINRYSPLSVDMETGSIAHVCYANDIPFLAIRSMSDTPKQSGIKVFEENCELAARHANLVLNAILCELRK